MKATFIFLVISICSTVCRCQTDSTEIGEPKLFHLSTIGTIDSVGLGYNFTVLSLVSAEMYDKWNSAELKKKYDKKSVLIVVARQDSKVKTKFIVSFYQNWISTGSKRRAYKRAIQQIDNDEEIKHILILAQ
jgi:hypothetical protein